MQILKAKEDQIQMLEDKMLTVIANANISSASDTSFQSPEKMRSKVCEDSLQVSLMDEQREESPPGSAQPSGIEGCLTPQTSVSTGSVSSNPPVKVS